VGDTRNGSIGCQCRCCRAARAFDVDDHRALVAEVRRRVNAGCPAVPRIPGSPVIGRQFTLDTLIAIAEARGDGDLPDATDREFVARAAHLLRPTAPIASRMAVKAVLAAQAEIHAAAGTAA